ncbi:hypothetical protein [Rhodococcus pyridinivorans]|uniref:Uncharacterized protein n=1 Tax=Rhodococcus pyridinivorans AK37 TaxID=1114960 RepID=H0JV42_9NOCA|nr:hypothetical protein [Rhodococcus pyridinivorans]EHK82138.1 hypothetical protein AK37_17865 [Rhodococcus pyridinivorans AK37]MCD2140411.1 hypothetical protein [Rhodococcus pyridinivorans]
MSSYTVRSRRNHSFEFDTNRGYLKAASETRVWPDGCREHIFLIGDLDFALTDAPQLAAAILNVYHAQLDAEGLIVKASHDD